MDSRVDTYEHIQVVQGFMRKMVTQLLERAAMHDQSKLVDPEKSIFDEFTPKLRDTTYGSDEYKEYVRQMDIGIQHHYAHNSHHPEHHENGIKGMTLLDLVEMICDWKAATMRHKDGDILKSIEINQDRFGYSDELKQILLNTLVELEN